MNEPVPRRVRRGGLRQRVRDDERGAGYLAAFIILFGTLTVLGVGILIDTARIVATDRQCATIALEAARAGANAIDVQSVRSGGAVVIDPVAAQQSAAAAASAFVAGSGATLTAVSVEGNRVSVTVAASVDPWFPVLSGRTVSASAGADAIVGVPTAGPP